MMTLRQFKAEPESLPTSAAWSLTELAEFKGKQDLFTRQSPQKLRVLRENAMLESALSSNRIEGITIDSKRIDAVLKATATLRDRDEQEVRGYQNALKWIHEEAASISFNSETVLKLHALCRPTVSDGGKYKDKDIDIVERYPDGRSRVRFRSLPWEKTPAAIEESLELMRDGLRYRWVPPLAAIGGFNLDFLCIHPFRDGNGRVSRLLLLLQLYQSGYEVGRYISLERIIEQNKERYYETLEQSSAGWHEGQHRSWIYINYLLYVLKLAYQEFEARVGQTAEPRGAKTEMVEYAVTKVESPFTLADIEKMCTSVSRDMIRKVLKDMQKAGKIKCMGRGPLAPWEKR